MSASDFSEEGSFCFDPVPRGSCSPLLPPSLPAAPLDWSILWETVEGLGARLKVDVSGWSHGRGARCWASWADALHMVADMAVRTLSGEPSHTGCLAELHQAAARLDRKGFWWRPTRGKCLW